MSPKLPLRSVFMDPSDYEEALSAYEDAMDTYAEECLERYFEERN